MPTVQAYSGSSDPEAGLFVMEYELEGDPAHLKSMCDDISLVKGVQRWSVGCALPSAKAGGAARM
jgi:hypothetical protein